MCWYRVVEQTNKRTTERPITKQRFWPHMCHIGSEVRKHAMLRKVIVQVFCEYLVAQILNGRYPNEFKIYWAIKRYHWCRMAPNIRWLQSHFPKRKVKKSPLKLQSKLVRIHFFKWNLSMPLRKTASAKQRIGINRAPRRTFAKSTLYIKCRS